MKPKKNIISIETEKAEKELLLEKYKTAMKKVQFLNEIKSGLGDEIKANPNGVKIIKKSWGEKLKMHLKKIFTKF